MRRLISDVAIWFGIDAVTLIALAVVQPSQSWRESTMFTAGALAEWIIRSRREARRHD